MLIKSSGQKNTSSRRLRTSIVFNPKVPHWWENEHTGIKSVIICEHCQAVYYDKHWHSWERSTRNLPKNIKRSAALCPACAAVIKSGGGEKSGYGGEALFSGLRDLGYKLEIINLIKNISRRALLRNPEDQIMKIEDKGTIVRVTTSGNQLAIAIGKQVQAAKKGGELKVVLSKNNLPARVRWAAPAKN